MNDISPAPSDSAPTVSLQPTVPDAYSNPRKGGIQEYLSATDSDFIPTGTSFVGSYTSNKEKIVYDPSWGDIVTFIPACDSIDGYFILYKDGKNIAEGGCGMPMIGLTLPPIKPEENPTFTFTVDRATKYEVEMFQRRSRS